MRRDVRISVAVVRSWTRCYTWRLARMVRDARRAEIDSDLHEHAQEWREERSIAGQMLARCLLGIADDLSWRSQMVRGPGRLEREVPMSERLKRNWWVPAPIALISAGALIVLIHVVGDGFESEWSRTASGWNPTPSQRIGAAALFGAFLVVMPICALALRRRHAGWTVVLLVPWAIFSLPPLFWGDAGLFILMPVVGITTLAGAIMNLAQSSVEGGSTVSSASPQHARS